MNGAEWKDPSTVWSSCKNRGADLIHDDRVWSSPEFSGHLTCSVSGPRLRTRAQRKGGEHRSTRSERRTP
jgi:hypothetical protein